jgi:hypothetical protein
MFRKNNCIYSITAHYRDVTIAWLAISIITVYYRRHCLSGNVMGEFNNFPTTGKKICLTRSEPSIKVLKSSAKLLYIA